MRARASVVTRHLLPHIADLVQPCHRFSTSTLTSGANPLGKTNQILGSGYRVEDWNNYCESTVGTWDRKFADPTPFPACAPSSPPSATPSSPSTCLSPAAPSATSASPSPVVKGPLGEMEAHVAFFPSHRQYSAFQKQAA